MRKTEEILRSLLHQKGMDSQEDISEFLSDRPQKTYDPFLAEGIIIGIISAGISVGISALLYQKIIDVIGAQVFSVLSMPMVPVGFLTYNFAWIFLALGISIGACGSIISMRKFLDA